MSEDIRLEQIRYLRPEQLREMREAAGLTRTMLSKLSRVSYELIMRTEQGKNKPQPITWKRLLQGLRKQASKSTSPPRKIIQDTWVDYEPPPPPPAPRFSFEVGRVYSIRDDKSGVRNGYDISPQYGTLCKFKYKGKRGIHHYFREVIGGWSRTYTDAQLIGKKIEEVLECTR